MAMATNKAWRPSVLDFLLLVVAAWAYAKAKMRWLATTAEAPYSEAVTEVADVVPSANESFTLDTAQDAVPSMTVSASDSAALAAARALVDSAGQADEEEKFEALKKELELMRARTNEKLAENHKVQDELIQRQKMYMQKRAAEQTTGVTSANERAKAAQLEQHQVMASIVYTFRKGANEETGPAEKKSKKQRVPGSDMGEASTARGLRFEQGGAALLAEAEDWEVDSVEVTVMTPGTEDAPSKKLGVWKGKAERLTGRAAATPDSAKTGLRSYYFRSFSDQKDLSEYHSATLMLHAGVAGRETSVFTLWKKP